METIRRFLDKELPSGSSGSGSGDGYGYGSGYGSGDGYGDGYGYGSGYGSGDGYGDGYGYGSGDGYGDGYGYGSGDGSGDGDGDGYGDGSGYGYGYGSGYGSGSGDGYGIASFNSNPVYMIDGVQTLIYHVRGNVAKGAMLNDDLSLTPCFVVKGRGLFAHGETLRATQEALHEKLFKNMDEDERIDAFLQEVDPGKNYPTKLFFDWHNKLTGSCEAGRKQFARNHDVDLAGTMTVQEFVNLTRDAFGGEVIRMLEERMQDE